MNFFEHQQRARQRSALLVFGFLLATAATVALTNLAVFAVIAAFVLDDGAVLAPLAAVRSHPQAFLWTSLVTLGAIGAACLYRMASLSSGGSAVARELGGVLIDPESRDPLKIQLRNIVEEMALASGVPAPQVYVLEQEPGINAFAAGFSTADAAIAVTRGALELLTRDELQGVIAHEFSHVLNGDMRLNTRLLGVLFGLLFIGLTGRLILRGLSRVRASSSRRGGNVVAAAFVVGLVLTVIGYIGMLFGTMLRAAVSRQREYLADASAVQFTRDPLGIAGALKKIAVSPLRAVLQTADAEEVGHMLIADGRKWFGSFFATHPPILARIKAIDRHFDPAELERIQLKPLAGVAASSTVAKAATPLPLAQMVIAGVGSPGNVQLEMAGRCIAALPEALQRAARSPTYAPALVLALALHRHAATGAAQSARLRQRLAKSLVLHLDAFATLTATLAPAQRLPLVELAFPALRQRPLAEMQLLIAAVDEIARMDGCFDVLDYTLLRLLRTQLSEAAAPQARPARPKLFGVRDAAAVLFAVVAQSGDSDKYRSRAAYEQGMQQLLGQPVPVYAPPAPWVAALDRALTRLDTLAPLAKQRLIESLVLTVSHDQQLTLAEAELLRAVCASLHCPLPPLALGVAPNATPAADTRRDAG